MVRKVGRPKKSKTKIGKRVCSYMDAETFRQFKKYCKDKKLPKSHVICDAIREFIR